MRRMLLVVLTFLIAALPMLAATRRTKAEVQARKAAHRTAAEQRKQQDRAWRQQIRLGVKAPRPGAQKVTTKPSATSTVKRSAVRRSLALGGAVTSNVGLRAALSIAQPYYGETAAAGDFDGDGKLDVAYDGYDEVYNNYCLFVRRGNGDGTFAPTATTVNSSFSSGMYLLTADLNGDQKADIINIEYDGSVDVYMNAGDGTSFTPISYGPVSGGYYDIGYIVTDVDGDGKLDLAVVNNQWVTILTGTGDNADPFLVGTANQWTTGSASYPVIGYLGGSSDTALYVAGETSSSNTNGYALEVAKRNADGTFDMAANTKYDKYLAGYDWNDTYFQVIADVNGDGKPDVVSVDDADYVYPVSVYLQQADGKFVSKGPFLGGGYNVVLTAADVDGDGKTDVVTVDEYGGTVSILRGTETGFAQPALSYGIGGDYPDTPAVVADFTGDGKPDIVVNNYEWDLAFLRNLGDGTFYGAEHAYPQPTVNVGDYYAYPQGVAFADFNNDGFIDVATGNYESHESVGVTVFMNRGDGSLAPGINVGSSGYLHFVAAGDLNGDGNADLVASDYNDYMVWVFFGNGNGTFQAPAFFTTSYSSDDAEQVLVVDVDGKNGPDVVVRNDYSVGVLLNDGTGNLLPVTEYSLSNYGEQIAAGDVDGDGKIDLVVRDYYGLQVLRGKGDGTFDVLDEVDLVMDDWGSENLAIVDLDGTGKMAVVTPTNDCYECNAYEGLAVALYNGDPTTMFDSGHTTVYPAALRDSGTFSDATPLFIAAADFNGDGFVDAAVANYTYSTVSLLFGDGTGAFSDPVEYLSSMEVYGLGAADLNKDGAPDVVQAVSGYNDEGMGVTTMLNTGGVRLTAVSSKNPAAAGDSLSVTVTAAPTVKGVSTTPTGTVKVSDGVTDVGTATLTNGSATVALSPNLAAGAHVLNIAYAGDSGFLASSLVLTQLVAAPTDYDLTADKTTLNLKAGETGIVVITVTPKNGFTGTVTFSYGTMPQGVYCAFSPASVTPNGKDPVTVILSITTTAPTKASAAPAPGGTNSRLPLWASLWGMGALGMVVVGGTNRKRAAMMLLGLLALGLLIGLMGCGHVTDVQTQTVEKIVTVTQSEATPTGSHTLSMTATAFGSSKPLTITINVN